jgi:ABC-2 type transport system permease protein
MLPASDTAPARTRLLTGPFGLACRLARRGALGWFAGLAGGGLILGLTAKGTEAVFSSQSGGVVARLGGTAGGASYLGLGFLIIALVIAVAAAGQAGATRDEEAEGYLDHLLARPVARLPWLAGRLTVSAAVLAADGLVVGLFTWAGAAATGAGLNLATLLAAGVNVVPAGIFVLGTGALVYGLAPRLAAVAAYTVVAWSFIVEIIGAGIGASRWLLDTSVLHHIARAPATAVNWDSATILTALGIASAIAGALAFTRRDLAGA